MPLPYLTYTLNGKTHPAGPQTLGLSGITLVTEKEASQVFYRTKWTGSITFTGKDFDLLWDVSKTACCQPVQVALYRQGSSCSDSSPYWKGVFTLSDLEFNIDSGQAVLSEAPKPDDGYQTLLENWEKTINWLALDVLTPIYSADRTILYRRGRLLTLLLSGVANLTLKNTKAVSLVPLPGSDVVSTFLESKLNPVTRRKNTLKDAIVVQASDFITPGTTSDPFPLSGFATKADLTLKELCDELANLLCLYPYIDAVTGKLRWEHESFFPYLSYDPPTIGYSLPNTRSEWAGKRTVKTNVTDLYGEYELTIEPNQALAPKEADPEFELQLTYLNNPFNLPYVPGTNPGALLVDSGAIRGDFREGAFKFSSDCVNRLPGESPKKKPRSTSRFTTYLKAARTKPESVNKQDWIFLLASSESYQPNSPTPQVAYGVLDGSGANVENGDLSASSLLRDFHRSNQPFFEALSNVYGYTDILDNTYKEGGIRRSMASIAPIRQLGAVTIPYCCSDQPITLSANVESWLASDGLIQRASYNLATELLTLDIAHPGVCQIEHLPPFNPDGTPSTCPPRGNFLRFEQSAKYPDNNASPFPCRLQVDYVYTDGDCGEYRITDLAQNGSC